MVLAGFAVLAAGASLFSVALCMLGTGFIALGLWMRAMRRRCARWLPTTGLMLESRLEGDDPARARPIVRYRYQVSGETYEGKRIAYTGSRASRAALQALIATYAEGTEVTVYHDPIHPALALLKPDLEVEWARWVGVGLLLIVLATVGFARPG
jgi:hypothetical protein